MQKYVNTHKNPTLGHFAANVLQSKHTGHALFQCLHVAQMKIMFKANKMRSVNGHQVQKYVNNHKKHI